MKRVVGIGGIFFKAKNKAALIDWYRKHLGLEIQDWGGMAFRWKGPDNPTGVLAPAPQGWARNGGFINASRAPGRFGPESLPARSGRRFPISDGKGMREGVHAATHSRHAPGGQDEDFFIETRKRSLVLADALRFEGVVGVA